MTDDGTFWDGPGGQTDEVVAGRYRVADPVTGQVRSWTRASNIGAAVADRWALERYQRRQLVRGIAARPDLIDLIRTTVELDNAKCDEVITTALQVAGSTVKANIGTTIHEVQRRVDLGLEIPEGMERYAEGYRAALDRAGLSVVAVEVLCCNRGLEAVGRADRIYREAGGSWVIGDTKSTDHLDLSQHEIAPQLTVYAHADYYDARGFVGDHVAAHENDRPAWQSRTGLDSIRQDYAIAVHVDRESGAVSLYRVDLYLGGYGANLATQVREWRNTKGILLPYVPPTQGLTVPREITGATPGDPIQRHLSAVPDPAPATLDPFATIPNSDGQSEQPASEETCHPGCTRTDPHTQWDCTSAPPMGGQPNQGSGVTSGGIDPGEPAKPPTPTRAASASGLLTEAELLKMTKAGVQQYGRDRGFTDLAHNRPTLVKLYAAAGLVAESRFEDGKPVPTDSHGRALSIPGDTAELPAGPIGNGEDPTDPRTDAFRRARLSEIGAAPSVADLWRINRSVVSRGGDQAWTDEMTQAARVRVADLDQRIGQVDIGGDAVPSLHKAKTQQDIADVWEKVTVNGSIPERWTEQLNDLAERQVEAIRLATPPAAANPFAST